MDKVLKWLSILSSMFLICALVLIPLSLSTEPASANDHPWADVYGFTGSGYNSYYGNYTYSTWHQTTMLVAGAGYPNTYDNPSLYYGLQYRGWLATGYVNASAITAYNNLAGNAYFGFRGHGYNGHQLNFNGSYMHDVPRAGDSGTRRYVCNQRNMDDMKFALLQGCSTAANHYGDGRHLAWEFRCDRGVDTVVAFTTNYWYQYYDFYPADIFTQEFSRGSQIYRYHVADSCAWAKLWVYRHCGNHYYGLNSVTIWGNGYNYIYTPGDGIYEGRP